MQKRALSILLALCMLLAMVPALVLPLAAAEGDVTIRFVDANVSPAVTMSEQTVAGTALAFEIPAVSADAFGWYEMTPAGAIREASTYLGETVTGDLTFYLVKKTSAFNASSNWPLYTAGHLNPETNGSLDAWRGGWTAGSYIDNTYTLFNKVNGYNILINNGVWSHAGFYLAADGGRRMVTQKDGMLALSYNAPISGVVDVDFDQLAINFTGDGNAMSDLAMAIAVNGIIVWPQAAAGRQVANYPVDLSSTMEYPYWNNTQISTTTYSSGHNTDWLYLCLAGDKTPETDAKLTTLKNLVEGNEDGWKMYCGTESDYTTRIATAEANLAAMTDTTSDEYTAAQAELTDAKAAYENWKIVKENCLTVSDYVKTGSLMEQYNAYCTDNDDAPHNITVAAGDRVDIVVSRVNNPHVTVWPKVTYTKITADDLVTKDNVLTTITVDGDYDLVQGGKNWPTTAATANPFTLTSGFGASWSAVGYNEGAITNLSYDQSYFTYGGWPEGILWLDDGRLVRTGAKATKDEKTNGVGFAYAGTSGTASFTFSFKTPAATADAPVYFSVYKYAADGTTKTLLYPNESTPAGIVADEATEGAGVKYTAAGTLWTVSLQDVTLAKGEKLALIWRNAGTRTNANWSGTAFAQNFTFRVRYTKQTGTTFDPRNGYNTPVIDFATAQYGDKVTYTGGWDLVAHSDTSTYDVAEVINTFMHGTAERWLSTGYSGEGIWSHKTASNAFGYVYDTDLSDRVWPNPWGVFPIVGATGGWRYTAEGDGVIDLDITRLRSQHNVGDYGYVAVFKNGKMIWPVAEGEGTNYYGMCYMATVTNADGSTSTVAKGSAKWAKIGAYKTTLNATQVAALTVVDGSEKTGSLTGISVQYGDEIEILVRNDDAATDWWNSDACGFTMAATVTYTTGQRDNATNFVDSSRVANNLPSAPEATEDTSKYNYYYQPVFGDSAWSFVAYPEGQITAAKAQTDFYAMNRPTDRTSWDDTFWSLHVTDTWNDWSNGKTPVFRIIGGGDWGDKCSIAVNTLSDGGFRYTAPSAGLVNVDITRLFTSYTTNEVKDAEGNVTGTEPGKNNKLGVAIYVDQVKVWPTDTDWYVLAEGGVEYAATVQATLNGVLDDISVGKGSTIDFLVHDMTDAKAWQTRGTIFQGAVSYKEKWDVSVDASVAIGDKLQLALSANALGLAADSDVQITMTGDGSVAAKDVSARIDYKITGKLYDMSEAVTLAVGHTTLADVLMRYVESGSSAAPVAVAALNYTAAAQQYFNADLAEGDLANAGLSDEQKTVTVTGTYTGAGMTALDGEVKATMAGMSLLLEDQICFKLVFSAVDATGYKVQVSTDNFANYTTLTPEATQDGLAYKAITAGIKPGDYNTTYSFRIVDAEGHAVSHTLNYSVAAYYTAMQSETAVAPVVKAIMALYEAAK